VSVAVVVPVRNGATTLRACLDALAAQEAAPPFEVTVVDNGSTDGTAEVARRHPVVTRVVAEARPGSYAARNTGVAASSGDVVAFLDADCVAHPRWLAAAVGALEGHDLAGGPVVPIRTEHPTIWERYTNAVYLDQRDAIEHHGFAATANLVVRRAALDAVGGFDATLRSSGDVDLCRRATAGGASLVFAPDAVVSHWPRTTVRETWKLYRRLGAGWGVLARRGEWPPAWRDKAMRPGLAWTAERVAADGPRIRRRRLVFAHALVLAAQWVGRLSRRG
jgi:glycosyltransferase involved in cell wall biosynthesis